MKSQLFIRTIIVAMCFTNIPSTVLADERSEFSAQKICKAAIAQIMGKNPKIISTSLRNNDIVQLSYMRENDGTKWVYRCKIIDNIIIWATETGRWRDHPMDSKLTYKISDHMLQIEENYGDRTSTKSEFTFSELN